MMEEATESIRKVDPWELQYADDLVLSAESRQEVEEMLITWSTAMELRGLKINITNTKLLASGKNNPTPSPTTSGCYPCAICNRGVGANSILCTNCNKSCHKRCTGLSSFDGISKYVCPVCRGTPEDLYTH